MALVVALLEVSERREVIVALVVALLEVSERREVIVALHIPTESFTPLWVGAGTGLRTQCLPALPTAYLLRHRSLIVLAYI